MRVYVAKSLARALFGLTAHKTLFMHIQVLHIPSYALYRRMAVASAHHSALTRSDEGLESKRDTESTVY